MKAQSLLQILRRLGEIPHALSEAWYGRKRQWQDDRRRKRRRRYSGNEIDIGDLLRGSMYKREGNQGESDGPPTGSWYLYWEINTYMQRNAHWSPFVRWARLVVVEEYQWEPEDDAEVGGDPTPHPSPEAALAQAFLLPLEINAAICPSAIVIPYCGGYYEAMDFSASL